MKTRRLANRRLFVEELESRLVPSSVSHLSYSTNWSGYAVTAPAGAVTSVAGSWIVPTIQAGRGTAYSAEWVGIDGFTSPTVEQIGTEADLMNGTPQYYAWYEMYPKGYVTVPLTIHAGDAISAAVSSLGGGSFGLTITDATTGQHPYTTTQSLPNTQLSSAEWIVEAPSSFNVLPLANFGTVTFSGAKATIAGTTGPINNPAWASEVNQIDMVASRSNPTTDTTSVLTTSGTPATSSFSVTSTPQVSAPTPTPPPSRHHRGEPPGRSPDQVFLFTNAFNAGNTTTVFAPQNSSTAYLPPSAFRPVPFVEIGPGLRPPELYLPGDSPDQAIDNDGDAAVAPSLATAKPQHNALPSMGDSKKARAEDARWLAAVDAVFAQDFAAQEDGLMAPTVWTGLHEEEQRSVAVALVLSGAVLALQPKGEYIKDHRPALGKNRRPKAVR